MTQNREHFSLEQWADFSRERASLEARAQMEQHLEQGCTRCADIRGMWDNVLKLAGREFSFEAPKDAVRCAKALYGTVMPMKSSTFSLRLARFAGFGPPVLEGVRGAGSSAGHYLFREGDLLLDMYMQPADSSGVVSMVGQLLDSTSPDRRFDNQPVSVLRETDALARTTTNEFGEFHLEFKPAEDLLLAIELENQSYLVSRLPALPAEGTSSSD